MLNETDLLTAANRFQPEALIEIYDLYHAQLYAYAYRTLMDAALAEDCVAASFERLITILHKGKGPTRNLRAYLYRIAHNWMMDGYRQDRRVQQVDDFEDIQWEAGGQTPPEALGARMVSVELKTLLRELTPLQREVIILRFLDEFSLQETAAVLKKPVGAVKSLQNRALRTMRRRYEFKE
jgi:RNA polymerase sigma-70 factor (ECF subfamily)